MATFPSEILETIIDSLALAAEDDHESLACLKACAFVCHNFHFRVRTHIFKSITLEECQSNGHNLLRFHVLISRTPEIAYYVRSLDYSIGEIDSNAFVFADTLRSLTSLRQLTIRPYNKRWDRLPFRGAILQMMHLSTLTHLTVISTTDFAISDLGPCTGIKSLALYNVKVETNGIKSYQGHQPPSLDRFAGDCGILIRQIYTTRRADGHPIFDFSKLQTLSLNLQKNQDKSDIQGFFQCCTQLKSVYLSSK